MIPIKRTLIVLLLIFCTACKGNPTTQRDEYYESGQKYLEESKNSEAIIQFRNALRLDKNHVPSYLGIAQALQNSGDHQNAIAAYQQVLALDGNNQEAQLRMGQYYLSASATNSEYVKNAKEMAEKVLAADPKNIEARILLSNAYATSNELDKAVQEIQKVLADDPANLSAALTLGSIQLRQKDMAEAENTFKQALEKHQGEVKAHLALATFYMAADRKPEVEKYLRSAFDLNPADSTSLYPLAAFYVSLKRQADAENVFKEAISRKPKEREPRWGLANFLLQSGRTEEGLQDLQSMLTDDPKDRQAELLIAEVLLGQNKGEEAEKHLQNLLSRDKNDAEAHYLLARVLSLLGQNDKALEELESAIRSKDQLLAAYLEKANLLMNRGDLEGAQTAISELLARDRDNLSGHAVLARILAMRQKYLDALQEAEQVLAKLPDNEVALAARGDAYMGLGRLKEAKEEFKKLSEARPAVPDYWNRLGIVGTQLGDTASALTHFRKALELDPTRSISINNIIYLLLKANRFDEAMAELDKLSKTKAPQDLVHIYRGRLYLTKEDFGNAENEFRKAIEVNPENYQAYLMLGQMNIVRNNVPQALKEVEQLISRDAKYAPAYLLKAYYLQVSNDNQGAIANYRKVLELAPENPVASNNLAWLLCESETDLDEALQLAQAAKKQAPENPEIADTLGWIYYKKKNYTLAVDQLLLSVNNRQPQAQAEHYYRLGMAYYGKGDLALAQQSLRKALELNPLFTGAEDAKKILQSKTSSK